MKSKELIESRQYLSEVSVWPASNRLDVTGWLSNFDEGGDQDLAMALLESHVHVDEEQIVQAVASTIRTISTLPLFGDSAERSDRWVAFLDSALVSFPLSRSGDSTASGYIFARIAKRLGFDEERILDSERLVARLLQDGPRPVLFLDDLAGSGTQFSRFWNRKHQTGSGEELSLADLSDRGSMSMAIYLPVVATVAAREKIESDCEVLLLATYLLDRDYGALDPDSRLVPEPLRPALPEFLAKYAPRTGKDEDGIAGYGHLALALSFHHSCPNNTLPILQWGPSPAPWKPLIT